jgi:FdhD protein
LNRQSTQLRRRRRTIIDNKTMSQISFIPNTQSTAALDQTMPDEVTFDQAAFDQATWRSVAALHHNVEGSNVRGLDVAEEIPLAILYNGVPHAVMMGTPLDLEDFALGFSIADGAAHDLHDLKSVTVGAGDGGITIDIGLTPSALNRVLSRRRVRSLRGHTSCGICGVEDLAQLTMTPAPRVRAARPIDHLALDRALGRLRSLQPLAARTHAAHAAAWVDLEGTLVLVREDVGRHNALDKLVGAALRADVDFAEGFCLITSRCSYEMAQKAVAAGIPALVAISAPTALAIRTAEAAGLTLATFDRNGGYFIYAAPNAAHPDTAKEHAYVYSKPTEKPGL